MSMQIVFSIVYFAVFSLYLGYAITVITQNPKEKINRMFFVILLLMAFWTFTFSLVNAASDYESALFWRRTSTLGWGLVFCFILRLMLLITPDRDGWLMGFLRSKVGATFIYGMGTVNVIIYMLWTDVANQQYNLVRTTYGWSNMSVDSPAAMYFNVYLVVLLSLIVWTSNKWAKGLKQIRSLKSSYAIIGSFAAVGVIGIIVDMVVVTYLHQPGPQVGALIGIIPITTVFATTNRFSFTHDNILPIQPKEFYIIPRGSRRDIVFYLAVMTYLAAVLSFAFRYFIYGESLLVVSLYSAGLMLMSAGLYFAPKLPIEDRYKDFITMAILSVFIPYMLFQYAIVDAAVTIWTLPVFVILLSIVFVSRWATIFCGAVSIVTLLAIGIANPKREVTILIEEHLLRVIIIIVFTWFAMYVKRLYVKRLKENEKQYKLQQLIAMISNEVLKIDETNTQEKLSNIFARVGDTTDVDSVFVMNFEADGDDIIFQQGWSKEHPISFIRKFSSVKEPILSITENDHSILIQDVSAITNEYRNIKSMLDSLDINSAIMFPVLMKDEVVGVFGLAYNTVKKKFTKSDAEQYRTISNILADAYQKSRTAREIHKLAYFDTLTALPNRVYLNKTIQQYIQDSEKNQDRFAVLFIDLDAFKWVNDSIGHSGGDQLLKDVAGRLTDCVGDLEKLYRFSGDEFVVLHQLGAEDDNSLHRQVEKILHQLQLPYTIGDMNYSITGSIGVAVYPNDGQTADNLIRNADLSMYDAKIAGKNQVRYCTDAFKAKLYDRHQMIMYLQDAVERDELVMYYQPQVNGRTGEIIGIEALIRWNNPDLGHVPPGIFIPIAEQTGLIIQIGEWVIENVCDQHRKWRNCSLAGLPVAINISSVQLKYQGFYDSVKNIIDMTGMDPALLEFEVTESVALKDSTQSVMLLNRLRDQGISIAIDDFGTEYSSLNRLKELPVDRVKIAMNFIHGITMNPKDEAVVNVIIYLAKKFNLRIIAEGVENEFQLDYLLNEGCSDIQGYFFHQPMSASALLTLVED